MSSGVSSTAPPFSASFSSPLSKSHNYFSNFSSNLVIPQTLCSSDPKLKGVKCTGRWNSGNIRVLCSSSVSPGGPGSGYLQKYKVLNLAGNNDSRSVLDAFFLGKAIAEAVNERIESTVGEVLSAVGRLQAEQQKQVQDFQEEVLERAKRAKEKAAREAMEAEGLASKSTVNTTAVADTVSSVNSHSTTNVVAPVSPPSLSGQSQTTQAAETDSEPTSKEEPVEESSNDE
ncbi:chromatin modification-related protein EAF1 A-like [Quillaja saponaria]|uniref:Chromatin modification-related protein EAF1 A-like n=1 Tax=Quillaja saponaria TaxID=32244 RepID=A0AAD7L2Y3_QUISA|nr:chromatin modification-related protein EAF1 A-like [Quillaja saponaria]